MNGFHDHPAEVNPYLAPNRETTELIWRALYSAATRDDQAFSYYQGPIYAPR